MLQPQQSELEPWLQPLVQHENSFEWLLKRTKQEINSCKEINQFLKKRFQIEEDYAKQMLKLQQQMEESLQLNEGKEGYSYFYNESSFLEAQKKMIVSTAAIGENRLQFSQSLAEISEELQTVLKDAERSRKQLKEAGLKYQKQISDAELQMEKSKTKAELSAEELEKNRYDYGLEQPQKSFNPFQKKKTPNDLYQKAQKASDQFYLRQNECRQLYLEYQNEKLPNLLRNIKETNDECDLALKALMLKYASLFEKVLLDDALILRPQNQSESVCMKEAIGLIDNQKDFEQFLMPYLQTMPRQNSFTNTYSPKTIKINLEEKKRIFGLPIEEVCRDCDVPPLITNCLKKFEQFQLSDGFLPSLPLNGHLKKFYERDPQFKDPQWNLPMVYTILFLFLKELPDPIFSKVFYKEWEQAGLMETTKKSLLKIHEWINQLPDAHYVTLKLTMKHFNSVLKQQVMSCQQLSKYLAPFVIHEQSNWAERVVQIVLENYSQIFDPSI